MAYGARLESVLGASPRGFESPILRHRTPEPAQVPGFSLCLQEKGISSGGACLLLSGYRTKRVGFMVTFRLVGAEKSVLKLVGANLKDGQNVLVL